jgi:hypothetical protein
MEDGDRQVVAAGADEAETKSGTALGREALSE